MKTQSIFKRNLNSLLLLIFLIFFISINSVSAIDDKFSITIKDNDTGLNLSVFNAVIENDASYYTTGDRIITDIPRADLSLENITICKTEYDCIIYTDYNISSDLDVNISVWNYTDGILNIEEYGLNIYDNSSIEDFNYTITSLDLSPVTENTYYSNTSYASLNTFPAGSYSISFMHPDFFTQTYTFYMIRHFYDENDLTADSVTFDNTAFWTDSTAITDNNLSTGSEVLSSDFTYAYMNYTKPTDALYANWNISAFAENESTLINLTLDNPLQLRFKADGDIFTIAKGTAFEFDTANGEYNSLVKINDTHYLNVYQGADDDGYAVILKVDDTTITKGTALEFDTANGEYNSLVKIDDTHYLNAYTGVGDDGYAVILKVDDTTITKGTVFEFDTGFCFYNSLVKINDTHYLNTYGGADFDGYAVVLIVDGTTITKGTAFEFDTVLGQYNSLVKINDTHYLNTYRGVDDDGYAVVLIVDGTTITKGTVFEFDTGFCFYNSLVKIDDTHYLNTYMGESNDGYAVVLMVDGTTITKGITFEFEGYYAGHNSLVKINDTHYLNTHSRYNTGYAVVLTVGGTRSFYPQQYVSDSWETLSYTDVVYNGTIYDEHVQWTYENNTKNLEQYESYQAAISFNVTDVNSHISLTGLNITLRNQDTGQNDTIIYSDGIYIDTFYANADTVMQIEVLHPDYIESVLNYTFESLEEATYVINLSYITTFNIYDEKTLLPFDFADPTSVTCLVFCEDKTEYYDVNSSVDEVPITCDYIKIKFVLEYPEGVSYYRKYLIEDGDLFNQSIYLIDASDTPYVYTAFIIDDLLGKYENPSIWIKKILSSGTEVIQSANIDIENKVGSYLIENDEYVIEVHSDNLPIQIIGEYDADEGEDKSINMYDINLASDPTGFSQSVTYTMKVINDTDTNISSVLFTYYDKDELTDSVQFRVYADRLNGTLIYESALYVNVSEVASLLFPLTGYENRTVVSEIEISHQDAGAQTVSRLLNKVWLVTLPMQKYITQESMNWFFIIFLSVIAIMSTSATSTAGLVVAGLAIIFRLFGWMEVSGGVLALAFLISLLDFFAKQGGR